MEFTVVTLVKNRYQQLDNLLESVVSNTLVPSEVIVVKMDNHPWTYDKALPIAIKTIAFDHPGLPLAQARNRGIAAATSGAVVFLDIDCICSPTLFDTLLSSLKDSRVVSAKACYMSYLPSHGNYSKLVGDSVTHPKQDNLPVDKPVPYTHFWSLVFAIQKPTFDQLGGFDENFVGYGAEDTDFAKRFDDKGIELVFVQDNILHQYHAKYTPPLNYVEDICGNANRFKQKHGFFPMYTWLTTFERMGLISFTEEEQHVRFVRQASADELEQSLSQTPY